MHAMPVMVGALCCLALAYRYYSAFLAARVVALDGVAATPAHRLADGRDYQPTSKWVLFGHHFAAISGAGPLIGPVLAAQFGYLPGLLWILVGVCLAGAVQDFLVLALSTRHNGESLAKLALRFLGPVGGWVATVAILCITVVALAGLAKVVVKALGGEVVKVAAGGTHVVPGSPWGVFTIAATIPIALFVGAWMFRIRPGRTVEASVMGAILTLGATVAGGWVARSQFAGWFDLSASQVTWAMAAYGFVAAVLPVWVLLCPRDYLSSFLKIGTIAALVVGTLVANPRLEAPAVNRAFLGGGPIIAGQIFPFLFITIMCGAISGFHALVSSGTTSKMLDRASHARTIGYGAMLIEGLVAVVATIAAASLGPRDYYAMNVDLAAAPAWHDRIMAVGGGGGVEHLAQYESLTQESLRGRTGGAVTLAVGMAHIFDEGLARLTGGTGAAEAGGTGVRLWSYWYHFAIMFEALFILTTIDAGTRIARFLLQEILGRAHPALGLKGHWLAAAGATAAVVLGWVGVMNSGSFSVIWAIFGIANQALAVIALAIVSTALVVMGNGRYLWVAAGPCAVVFTTTMYAGVTLLTRQANTIRAQVESRGWGWGNATLANAVLQAAVEVLVLGSVVVILTCAARRIVWRRVEPAGSAALA